MHTYAYTLPSLSRRSERRRHENICGKYNSIASTDNVTAQYKNCLVQLEDQVCAVEKMGEEIAVDNTTGLRRRLHPHWRISLLQSLCRAFGQTEASSNF